MSNNENGDLNETENNVEGASNAKNTDDSGDVRQEKKLPFNEELRNSDENVGLGSDEKMDDAAKYENVGLGSDEKDVVMQDAAKCKDAASDVVVEEENEKMEEEKVEGKNGEEEKGAPYYEGSVAGGVNAVIPDARSVEVGNGNQDVVEVTVSVKDASVGDILKNSNGKGNDREDTKLGSQDNGGDNAKESSTKNEGSDVDLLNQKSLVAKSGDDKKGDELKKDGSLEVKPLASGNETGSNVNPLETKAEGDEKCLEKEVSKMDLSPQLDVKNAGATPKLHLEPTTEMKTPNNAFLLESADGYESGTEEEQVAFLKDVEKFHKENNLEFKPPKFYKEELNLLKLWRSVIKLGGYEQVTSCKLWRQVGESFKPPKTCTTVSWTFRIFYEKALLEYEKGKLRNGELPFSDGTMPEAMRDENQGGGSQALGSGRARRDAAARAMQGWHSQRVLSNGQVSQPIIKDKNLSSLPKIDKLQKTNGLLKRKKPSGVEQSVSHVRTVKQQGDSMVIDIGPPADWVKINVQRTNDCFEVYALVPGLLREEVHVQSDPAGRLIISGQPEQLDNPWGVTPFKKVVSLPSRIDPHQTSAVVTLHGQLFVRVPFEQSEV